MSRRRDSQLDRRATPSRHHRLRATTPTPRRRQNAVATNSNTTNVRRQNAVSVNANTVNDLRQNAAAANANTTNNRRQNSAGTPPLPPLTAGVPTAGVTTV